MKASDPTRVARGFTLLVPGAANVSVSFDGRGLVIQQGKDMICIATENVEQFKRGMTWVRADVITSQNP